MLALKRKYHDIKGRIDFLNLVRDPNDTHRIFRMNASLKRATPPETIELFMKRAYSEPRLEAQFESGYWPAVPTLAELEAMPAESFGRAFAAFLRKWNLDPGLFPKANLSTRS